MSHSHRAVWIAAVVVVALGVSAPVAGAEIVKHSGTVLAIDRQAGMLVLGEVGPWRVERGETRITRRTISVISSTEFALVKRAAEPAGDFPGAFTETPLGAWGLREGDFVTVDCLHEGKRMTALKVLVTEAASLAAR